MLKTSLPHSCERVIRIHLSICARHPPPPLPGNVNVSKAFPKVGHPDHVNHHAEGLRGWDAHRKEPPIDVIDLFLDLHTLKTRPTKMQT